MSRRHNVKRQKFSRNFNQRKALLRGLLVSLIDHGEINTTLPKAKATKRTIDKLVSKAQKGTLHARRQLIATLASAKAANKLVDIVAPIMGKRTSGFTTISKTKIRRGDAATMATLKFITPLPQPEKKVSTDKKKKQDKKIVKQDKKTVKKGTSKKASSIVTKKSKK